MADNDMLSCLHQYIKNFENVCVLEDVLYKNLPFEEWLSAMKKRSATLRAIFNENQDFVSFLKDTTPGMMFQYSSELVCDIYQSLYELYFTKYSDPFVLLRMAKMLIPYYEKNGPTEDLIFLYTCAGYSALQISRTDEVTYSPIASSYYQKVLQYKDSFPVFERNETRRFIFVAYYNLIMITSVAGGTSLEESIRLWHEMNDLHNQEEYSKFDEQIPHIHVMLNVVNQDFLSYVNYLNGRDVYDKSSVVSFYKKLIQKQYLSFTLDEKNLDQYTPNYVFSYYISRAVDGQISWDKCFSLVYNYYETMRKTDLDAKRVHSIFFYGSLTVCLLMIIEKTSMTEEEKLPIYENCRKNSYEFFLTYPSGHYSFILNASLQYFSSHPTLLKSFQSYDEKLDFICHLIMTRHLYMFIHSVMVEMLSETILNYVIAEKPELLCGSRFADTTADVTSKRSELVDFIKSAALLHDMGKNGMVDVIKTQHRKIFDEEFAIIKLHPQKGYQYLQSDPELAVYGDIALGHHKSYDGKSGYPAFFDNTTSDVRIFIDIVRICDCLDAATDPLCRNYSQIKSFSQVLSEFEAGKGTQYHPELVDLIMENKELYKELSKLLYDDREKNYYNLYDTYFTN